MKITQFNGPACRKLREHLDQVLSQHGIEGVSFEVGGMRYSDSEVQVKLIARTSAGETKADDMLASNMEMDGIAAATTKDGWKITGYRPSRYKYPYSVESPRGARYKMTPEQAKARFGAA